MRPTASFAWSTEGSNISSLLARAKEIGKTYGVGRHATTAVEHATFEIQAGSSIALVGPSGSGKTTLLHLIAGLDIPSEGFIEWPALGAGDTLRPGKVAVAFQGPSLVPSLNVVENVALPVLLAGGSAGEAFEKARAILDRMSLLDTIESKLPEELSGGQDQRVGIARALVGSPALILTDEPTGQLDHENGLRLMDLLLSYIEETGATLIVATHDMTMAGRLATVWSMLDGHLRTEGV